MRSTDVLRGRHGALRTIRARPTDFAHAEEPRAPAATGARADCRGDARGAARGAGDRVPAGHVPGHGADGAADSRAKRGGHVCVPARARDLERVGDGRGLERDGRRAGAGADVALFVCEGLGAAMRLLSIRPLEQM